MNISAPFIRRPVATILLTVGVALCGGVAFIMLPVAPLPRVDVPAIFVSAQLPGASPEVMASTVATPLERHLGAIADVDDMTSSSSVGSANIQLTFGVDRDIDGAARDVQAAIVAAHADLPSALTHNPSYKKINSALFPVMAIAMTSDVLTQGQIYDAADAVISQRLSQIQGVGGVNVNGSALPAVRVEINPQALSKYGIGLQDVRAAISNANANAPKGAIESTDSHYQIYTNDNARDAAPYRNLIIANRNGAVVRLGDVAQVLDMDEGATENVRTYGLYNGKPAVFVTIYQQPGANVIEMIDAVKAELPSLKNSIDPKIDLVVTFDRSVTIRASLRQVEETLLLAVAMVILVVYVFLNSYRAALIPALVVPVSLIGTFGAMYLLDYTLDNFSLMALTIATGFVVDDAIVVMENTTRHIEAGMGRLAAAMLGAREVGFTVLSMSLSLIAVFIPFMFAGGIVGKIFREFTVTLSVSILISLVISLTTTPMMCSLLLERESERRPSRFARAFEREFERLRRGYERTLDWALRHPRTMMLMLLATIGFNVYLYIVIPKGFFPQQDTGQLQGGIRGDASSSFQLMKRKLQEVAKIVEDDPAVSTVTGSVGGGGFGPPSGGPSANLTIALKPLAERRIPADQIIARLRPKLARVQGVSTFLQAVQDIGGGGGRSANSQYQYTLLGDDLLELRTWSQKLRAALQDLPELTDVDTDLQPGGLEADLIVDRDTASRLGLTEIQIDNALGDAFAQAQVSTIYNPFSPQQYHVVMEVAPEFWQNPDVLNELYISTAGGAVSGTQSTQAVAGTTTIGTTAATTPGAAAATAAAIAGDTARNAALNSLANAGRGNTSTGSAVSVSTETVVPFSAFSRFTIGTTPVSVNHTGTSVSTAISFNLPDGEALGKALAAIDAKMNQIHVPVSIHGGTYGTARLFQQSNSNTPLMLVAALLAIYVVLGVLYESYSQPLTILSTLPSAGVGALLALLATGTEFSLIAFLGILLLIGIVKKNAIMMVDFALEAERTLGMDPRAAIAHACSLRFRPIMMTTCAAIAGALPLALAYGDGTEMRRPLGISIVGGLLVSQILTVYTTPVVYLYVHRYWKHLKEGKYRMLVAGSLMLAAGCAVGPDYQRPPFQTTETFKEQADWKPSEPNDALDRGPWWTLFGDDDLSQLEAQVDISNENVKSALAAYDQAAALVAQARAGLWPSIAATVGAQRGATATANSRTTVSAGLSASWTLDIWGQLRRTVESDRASAQASAAALAAAKLSAQGTLATDYFELRAQDQLERILEDIVEAEQRSLKITQSRYKFGVAAKADVVTAQTQLLNSQAQQINAKIQRATLEHAIAVLLGKQPAAFALPPTSMRSDVPTVPAGVPSALLERRPDVAEAERRMAASNAQIGVAKSAYFPALTLSGSDDYAHGAFSGLLNAPNRIWSVGPQLAETLIDGGLRRAQVAGARAAYDASVANYRQTVLTGFEQVEDELVTLRVLEQQAVVEDAAVVASKEAERLTLNQYKAGTVPYSSVITAQTTRLSSEESALTVLSDRLQASVALIEALGGGWSTAKL